jgi:putative alpha-1,2-mannosidase
LGNEDCGEMSAWYVLNSMGFYSYCPGKPEYSIGRPLFDEVKINLENGKVFTIKAINNAPGHKYVQSAKLNGKPLYKMFFSHNDLMNGGLLEITMK